MPVQQVDIMPTLLELLGIPVPKGLQGSPLSTVDPVHRRLGAYLDLDGAVARSVVQDGWHALQGGRAGYLGNPELYRIDVDPRERHDLTAGGVPALPAALLSLDRSLIRRDENRFASSSAQLDEETRKELEALGYLH